MSAIGTGKLPLNGDKWDESGRSDSRGVMIFIWPEVASVSAKKTRIMYIEDKSAGLNGPARIGRVTFSKTGQSIHYDGRNFLRLGGGGFKANYFDEATGDQYWISGPRKDGEDRLYPTSTMPVEIDADVAEEYWRDIRGRPAFK
jgi:hypothetical protein